MRKKAVLLFILKLIKIPLNIILLSMTAKYFGVSLEKDVWILAFTTMSTIDAALWGPINETFRTKFIFLKENNSEETALVKTQSLLTYFILFSVLLVGGILAFPDYFTYLIAPDYDVSQRLVLVKMIYYVAPVLLFNQLMSIGISILNAYEIFFIAEVSGFFSTIINIALIYFFVERMDILSLPLSYYISTLLLIAFIVFFIIKKKIPLFKANWNFSFDGFKTFFLFAIPFFLPYFFGQINSLVEKILASGIREGVISSLDYANRIPTLMYGIVVSIITTILVPVLSKYYIKGDKDLYNDEFRKMFQLGLLIISFITAFIAGASLPMVKILYDRGSISTEELISIADLSILYGISLLGIFGYVIFGMSLLSSENQKYYAFIGMATQIAVITINFLFVKLGGIYIFPISIFFSHSIFAYFMYLKYPFRKDLNIEPRYFLLVIIIVSIMYFGMRHSVSFTSPYPEVIFQAGVLAILLFILSYIFRLEERQIILKLISQKIKQLRK